MSLIGFGKEIPQSIGSIVVRSIVNKYWLNSVVCGCHHVHVYSHLVFPVDTIVRIHACTCSYNISALWPCRCGAVYMRLTCRCALIVS